MVWQPLRAEITRVTCWEANSSIKAYAGESFETSKLYPKDYNYEPEPDDFTQHYQVAKKDKALIIGVQQTAAA
ncbi:MAG: hypothetical protein PVG19_06980, partial [Desulfobacterales bacterium]